MLSPDMLHVVAAYNNPRRYAVRPRLLLNHWLPPLLESGARVTIAQHTIGARAHDLDPEKDPILKHVNLVNIRGGAEQELWLQHALYNAAIARLPEDAQYICWQDTDIVHLQPSWVADALHMLQTHRVGQTWTHAIDLDPTGNVARNEWGNDVDRSFCAAWLAGDVRACNGAYAPNTTRALLPESKDRDWRQHTGASWVIRRGPLQGIGRLLDWMIIGSGDYHMGHGFAGTLPELIEAGRASGGYAPSYYRRLAEFASLCDVHIRQDIGCLPGTITHGWHGPKTSRFYGTREDVMRDSGFDPDRDIALDVNGLPTLCGDNRKLRDGLRRYNRRRNEDSVDV
jgi:hypothetical protein